jgi:membrane protease YdiL (CAAX protease family)
MSLSPNPRPQPGPASGSGSDAPKDVTDIQADITATDIPLGPGPGTPGPEPPIPALHRRRIPNLGHAAIFVAFAGLLLLLTQLILAAIGKAPASLQGGVIKVQHPVLQIVTMAGTYLVTLAAAWLFFPLLWHRKFLDGLQWSWQAARRQLGQLVALGLVVGLVAQMVTYFITPPKSLPIDEFFTSPGTAWIITLFGTVVAPIFEEITFRGFLVPAFAIAYDWIALPRTEQARLQWRSTSTLSPAGLIFSAVLSSLCFALLHAQQVSHLWAALLVLFSISLVLTFVRVKTQSVAASALVHGAYNGFVFLTVIFATGGYRHLDRMPH